MFLGLCALMVIALIPVTGGSLRRLADLRIRWFPLALAALGVQVLVMNIWPGMPHGLAAAGHIASYVMLAAVVWVNRSLTGMLAIGIGAGMNAVAITANDGTLPATQWALRASGISERAGFHNSGVLAHPHLSWLGDIMVTPSWLPFRNMLSMGDVVLVVGAVILVWFATHRSDAASGEPVQGRVTQNSVRIVRVEPAHRPVEPAIVGFSGADQ